MTFLKWACWTTLVVGAGLLLLRYLPLRSPALLSLVITVPYLPLAMVPATVTLLATREWVGSTIGLAMIMLAISTQVAVPITQPREGEAMRIMSINVAKGAADVDAVVDAARLHNVDAVAVQELTPAFADGLEVAGMPGIFPFSVIRPDNDARGTGLWSRFPISEPRQLEGFGFACVAGTIEFKGGKYDLVATHITAPIQDQDSTNWITELAHIRALMDTNPNPLVIAGDFNATVDHRQFRGLLHGGTQDAARQAGRFYVNTFPANWSWPPFAALDHILVPSELRATTFETVEIVGSDHLAIVGSLVQR
ncbi:endonuclease/exonuclease/phosphatase family protein [Rhodococcus sp. IEGM 1241]|uniref:endonuclease/exonuclease/phosphatase family protein n=1 Tax=Rhodococcus TaxID=1827 RepID=UPI002955B175|nr:endonuclease/exonuclease/phosphatase family protein [Rhodococcus sp. IEGM 1241]MDV8011337.1 endonuclease/exonuclease/phosphatase family protein [Rhodococcus sp. IEGM 1241]